MGREFGLPRIGPLWRIDGEGERFFAAGQESSKHLRRGLFRRRHVEILFFSKPGHNDSRRLDARWREKLGDQQEVLLHAADMIIDTFATESTLLRARASADAGLAEAALQGDAARVQVNDAALRIRKDLQ